VRVRRDLMVELCVCFAFLASSGPVSAQGAGDASRSATRITPDAVVDVKVGSKDNELELTVRNREERGGAVMKGISLKAVIVPQFVRNVRILPGRPVNVGPGQAEIFRVYFDVIGDVKGYERGGYLAFGLKGLSREFAPESWAPVVKVIPHVKLPPRDDDDGGAGEDNQGEGTQTGQPPKPPNGVLRLGKVEIQGTVYSGVCPWYKDRYYITLQNKAMGAALKARIKAGAKRASGVDTLNVDGDFMLELPKTIKLGENFIFGARCKSSAAIDCERRAPGQRLKAIFFLSALKMGPPLTRRSFKRSGETFKGTLNSDVSLSIEAVFEKRKDSLYVREGRYGGTYTYHYLLRQTGEYNRETSSKPKRVEIVWKVSPADTIKPDPTLNRVSRGEFGVWGRAYGKHDIGYSGGTQGPFRAVEEWMSLQFKVAYYGTDEPVALIPDYTPGAIIPGDPPDGGQATSGLSPEDIKRQRDLQIDHVSRMREVRRLEEQRRDGATRERIRRMQQGRKGLEDARNRVASGLWRIRNMLRKR